MARHAHTFIPVNGSVPPWPLDEVPLEADEPDVLLVVDDDCESVPLVVEGEPAELDEDPLEPDDWLEPDPLDPEFDEPLGCVVVEDPVRGSTYC